ncbi:uncharacterized protein LOC125555530 [Triticum urartu]|uniref:uncharacterized protein LOC125555530 n=1 Tax=Triticum urartu TaxID=4572 RepID=UPI0020433E12|nr:uncharacterized protein LOC125555530 [Triticum urartu]
MTVFFLLVVLALVASTAFAQYAAMHAPCNTVHKQCCGQLGQTSPQCRSQAIKKVIQAELF